MLRIADLNVSLGRRTILQNLDLDARPGAVTVVLGPNGSGKSTLIRAASGELRYSGSVKLEGMEVARTAPWRLAGRRAVLAQNTPVAFPFTVAEIVGLGLHSGVAAAEPGTATTDIVQAALTETDMAEHAARPFPELSGGQQARVHLARVRAQVWQPTAADGPRWLFLDEPVAALDIAHQLAVMRVMRRFADRGGGVIAVMHDLNLSAMVADRIVLMNEGRILAEGAPADVLCNATLSQAYGCAIRVGQAPAQGPYVLPQLAGG